ncbi:DUF6777 domain-containing protein [Streptomyces cinnamoneus]|uniref:DUF6777 domain-containing protein n=1 Tax=Streptomyces cinnamoneus TaxID=53446 RepID=UPI0015E418FA|nr:DUF6777 domain-containing protein [Streptomyces cinnamoneus]
MSSQPPSGNRPTGPPSGPLSGRGPEPPAEPGAAEPTRPDWTARPSTPSGGGPVGPEQPPGPPGPPVPPTGGGGGDEGGGAPRRGPAGGGRPWWRSLKGALLAGAVLVAAGLAVFFLRQGKGPGEVFLQAASSHGRDPFTASTALSGGGAEAASPAHAGGTSDSARSIQGGTEGLFGGTRNVSSCDVDRQINFLTKDQAKLRGFAGVVGRDPGDVPAYLRSLTPVQLRADTRVTNHGWRNGSVTSFQSVLQAGTAVLADERGMPKVRCACGNPLTEPVAVQGAPKPQGDTWPAYRPADVVVVTEAESDLKFFVLYDAATREWFKRPVGTRGDEDELMGEPPKGGGLPTSPPKPTAPAPGPATSKAATTPEKKTTPPTTAPPTTKPPTTTTPPTEHPTTSPPT